MRTFYAVFACVIVVLVVITLSLQRESTDFYGIADAREIIINWESGVEIARCRVMPGQKVRQGDTIVELASQELDLRINEIMHQLSEIQTRTAAHATMSRSEIRQLRSMQEERAGQLRSEIRQLESELETNRRLVAQLRSLKADSAAADSSTPAAVRLAGLRQELARVLDSSQVKVDELHSQLSYVGDPLRDQVSRLRDELAMMTKQKTRLFIVAQISGVIGSVNIKEGEKVSPFATIATLHPGAPSYVLGYIHENVYSRAAVGQKVRVRSMAAGGGTVEGEIVGVGSRIVEYPVRLRRMPEVQMWGREITIKVPGNNPFLLGEKVMVSLPGPPGSLRAGGIPR